MTDPRRLFTMDEGADANMARDLGVVRRDPPWSRDEQVASYWAIRRRAASASAAGSHRIGWLVSGASVAMLAVVAVVALRHGPEGAATELSAVTSGTRVAGTAVTPESVTIPQGNADAGWVQYAIPGLGTLEATRGTRVEIAELPTERQVRIGPGVLRAQILHQAPTRPVVVVSPELRTVVVGTRFDVFAQSGRTVVHVLEGLVRVENLGQIASAYVGAGGEIASDDERLQPPTLTLQDLGAHRGAAPAAADDDTARAAPSPGRPALTLEGCEARSSLEARERCLLRLSQGRDLRAQNALFALAMLAAEQPDAAEEAYDRFHRFETQFPDGALAAEAALRQMELLRRLGRTRDAQAAAAHFQQRFASDPRAGAVAVIRAQLLCSLPDQRRELETALNQLSERPEPAIRHTADELRARCLGRQPAEDLQETVTPGDRTDPN